MPEAGGELDGCRPEALSPDPWRWVVVDLVDAGERGEDRPLGCVEVVAFVDLDLELGQIDIWLGSGNTQYMNQMRPRWMAGNMPAAMTAKIVMASAARLMEVRHFCRKRNRIAEISVPAWPMPIQNTKLTMGHPQPTGTLLPQTPTPVQTR